MTLQEAIKSGKRYRVVGDYHWHKAYDGKNGPNYFYSTQDLFKNWEIEEEKEETVEHLAKLFTSNLEKLGFKITKI